jgi:hypothetical protein
LRQYLEAPTGLFAELHRMSFTLARAVEIGSDTGEELQSVMHGLQQRQNQEAELREDG